MNPDSAPNLHNYQVIILYVIEVAFTLLRNLVAIQATAVLFTLFGLRDPTFTIIVSVMSLMLAVQAYLRIKSLFPVGTSPAIAHPPSIIVAMVTVFSSILLTNLARQLAFTLLD